MGADLEQLRHVAEFWDQVMIGSLVAAALVAGAVGISTWRSIVSNGAVRTAENDAFDRYKVTSDERAAELEKEAAAARERTAALDKGIADARERAAGLERDAAAARLEQERLKAQLAWRTLPEQMRADLKVAAAQRPGRLNVKFTSGDTEAMYLAIQIGRVFDDAGWEVANESVTFQGIAMGLRVLDDPSGAVGQVLSAAGIGFTSEPLPPTIASMGSRVDGPILFIGTKPPPH